MPSKCGVGWLGSLTAMSRTGACMPSKTALARHAWGYGPMVAPYRRGNGAKREGQRNTVRVDKLCAVVEGRQIKIRSLTRPCSACGFSRSSTYRIRLAPRCRLHMMGTSQEELHEQE